MAHLVPSQDKLDNLPTPLTGGEQALMFALQDALDDDWTIYVQPFINGLQPDIIIFSEKSGLGMFEVKDWNLNSYRVNGYDRWQVYSKDQGGWQNLKRGPLAQVHEAKNQLLRFSLPELDAAATLDPRKYGLIRTFVYFHRATTQTALDKAANDHRTERHRHTTIFGYDSLDKGRLLATLAEGKLNSHSIFSQFMAKTELKARLLNAMSYPQHGQLEVSDILFPLTPQQERLLANDPGKRRVFGSAGSGKTLLVARKAVNAALDGRQVLVVCFNLTMMHYLNDVINRLSKHSSPKGKDIRRNIIVRHLHGIFPGANRENVDSDQLEPSDGLEKHSFDVMLIDEAQDLHRPWIINLYELSHQDGHVMLMEDDRQKIYLSAEDSELATAGRERPVIPGISGRPNLLNRSFRVTPEIAAAADRLIGLSAKEFESGSLNSSRPETDGMLVWPLPKWFDGEPDVLLQELRWTIGDLVETPDTGAFADTAVLVCTVEDGWNVCDQLDALSLPYACCFESRTEHQRLQEQNTAGEPLKVATDALRRAYKMAFRMQTGRIKVCTIHSFKGWELRRVFVYFNPNEKQREVRVPLLYTAMTRAQDELTIFNADEDLSLYGRKAAAEGLLDYRQLAPTA